MNIIVSTENLTIRVKIIGGVNETDKESLTDSFNGIIALAPKHVHLDLSLVPFISSSGIGKLVVLNNKLSRQKAELIITGIHENLHNQFTSHRIFKIEKQE